LNGNVEIYYLCSKIFLKIIVSVTIKSSASLISVRPKCRKNNFFAFWLLGNEFFAFKVFIIAIRIFGLLFGSAGMLKKCGRKILGVLQQQTIFANAACL